MKPAIAIPPAKSQEAIRARGEIRTAIAAIKPGLKARLLSSAKTRTVGTKPIKGKVTGSRAALNSTAFARYVPKGDRLAVSNSFEGKKAEAIELEEDVVVYRYTKEEEAMPGQYFATKLTTVVEARKYLSLPNNNSASKVKMWVIRKGTIVLVGKAAHKLTDFEKFGAYAEGGAIQVYAPDRNNVHQVL